MDHILALRAFVRIAEAGSFAKAADSMNLPRSSVSKLLQDLEAHLGARLVERTTRAVTVTSEGFAYLERAVRVLADIDDMDSTVAGGRAPRGRLRVDVGSSLANVLVIPALPSFQAAYPEIDLQLGISDRPVDLIGEGVDCVIRSGPLPDNTSLVARKLCELDWVTCASPAYLAGREVPQVPADLERGHRIVAYFSAESGRQMPLRYLHNGEPLEISARASLSVNESTAHITTLAAGLGIGQTYGFMMRQQGDALIELLADFKPRKQVLHLVYPAGRFPSQKLRSFSDWIAGVCAAHGRKAASN